MEGTNPNQNVASESSIGPVIGVIIILVVVLLGGLYFWSQRDKSGEINGDAQSAATPADNTNLTAITTQSSSDDTSSIEADLNATNVDNLDTDLSAQ